MREIIESEPFILFLTVLTFYIGLKVDERIRKPFTNPLLIAIIILLPMLKLLDIDYDTYDKGSRLITFLLGPTVVALGYNMHKQVKHIKNNLGSILATISVGSLVGIISVIGICKIFGTPAEVITSLEPKSVTMAIALSLSEHCGGLPALTAISVTICGVFGSVIGPWFLDKLKVKSKVARGLAMGAAAHGTGTSRAMEEGQIQGAIAGMAIGLMGVCTSIFMPLIEMILKS